MFNCYIDKLVIVSVSSKGTAANKWQWNHENFKITLHIIIQQVHLLLIFIATLFLLYGKDGIASVMQGLLTLQNYICKIGHRIFITSASKLTSWDNQHKQLHNLNTSCGTLNPKLKA